MPDQKISVDPVISDGNMFLSTTYFPVVDSTDIPAQANKRKPGNAFLTALIAAINALKIWEPYNMDVVYVNEQPAFSVTGVTVETVMATVLIPANTIKAGDVISWKIWNRKTGANAQGLHRLKVNTTPDLAGTPVLIGTWNNNASTAVHNLKVLREIFVRSLSQSYPAQNATASGTVYTDDGSLSTPALVSIDWTVDQYFVLTSNPNNVADTVFLEAYYMRLIRKP